MTSPMVSSRTVGAPEARNSAVSGVMLGIRKPNPMTIPAASMAWMTTMSGSIAPIEASDHRSSVLKLVHGLTWTGAITSDDGDAVMAGAAVGSLIGGLLADEHGGRVAGRSEEHTSELQ